MKHQTPTYVRKGKAITHVESSKTEDFPSISKARRRSRELQQSQGKCGDGFLRVTATR